MRLVWTEDVTTINPANTELVPGELVTVGDIIHDREGLPLLVRHFARPSTPNSSGKVTLSPLTKEQWISVVHRGGEMLPDTNHQRELYVSLIGAEWVEREDRDGTWRCS